MNWTTLHDTLDTWFKRATGLSIVSWDKEKTAFPAYPFGELALNTWSNVGTDEVRRAYDPTAEAGHEVVNSVSGHRTFTLSCKARSRDNRPGYAAIVYIEKARNSLAKPNTIALFQEAEISLIEATPSVELPGLFQDREDSFASFDLRMCAVINETDPLDAGGYISKVQITSDLKDVDGESIPNTLQLDKEEIS